MSKIKSDVSEITPTMAEAMLRRNDGNRPVRQANVDRFAGMMTRGEWKVTHQGVAFDTNGKLVDGQHRLMGIVKSGCTVKMMVTHGLEPEVSSVMDLGAKRSAADMLRTTPMIAELCNFAARVITGEGSPPPAALERVYAGIGKLGDRLHEACPSRAVYFSSASMRLAAVVRMLEGEDETFVLETYTKLCRGDIEHMSPSAQALVKMKLRNDVTATDKAETLARGMHVFTKAHSGNMRAKAIDKVGSSERAREVLQKACGF